MDQLKSLSYEISVALEKCRQQYYSLDVVKHAMRLLEMYRNALADEKKKTAIFQLMQDLMRKREEAENLEKQVQKGVKTEGKKPIDLDDVCPLFLNASIDSLVISDTSSIESNSNLIYRDNALIVCGPFESELLCQVKSYVKKSGRNFRIIDLAEYSGNNAKNLLSTLSGLLAYYKKQTRNEVIIYNNLEVLRDNLDIAKSFCLYLRLIRQLTENVQQFLLLTDPKYYFSDYYVDVLKKSVENDASSGNILQDDMSANALNCIYLRLPWFETVKDYICRQFNLAKDDATTVAYIKENCYCLGYEHLSYLIKNACADDWKSKVDEIKSDKKELLDTFIERIGANNIRSILDDMWGYTFIGEKSGKYVSTRINIPKVEPKKYILPTTSYDYDASADIDVIRRSVQYILDCEHDANKRPISIMAKCGLVLIYALTNGDSMNNVLNLDDESLQMELRARWNIAYAALSQLMCVPYGQLKIDIPAGASLRGECCDRGNTIRINEEFVSTRDTKLIGSGCQTMLHELYHAVQYAAQNAKQHSNFEMLDYYAYHFGVTIPRIEVWEENNSRYHLSESDYNVYRDQVVEADARVFAFDAWEEGVGTSLAKLNSIK